MFGRSVTLFPNHEAIEYNRETVTYKQLDQRIGLFCENLSDAGVERGETIGLQLSRSIETMIALLAVYKIQGCPVPIDPAYPESRMRHMLGDSGASWLLHSDPRSKNPHKVHITRLDTSVCSSGGKDEARDDLAYVIYTSGSTGQPKGVALPQHALGNLIQWQIDQPCFRNQARTLQYASLSFDVSYQEIFSTFASGGTLVLMSEKTRRDPEKLIAYLRYKNIERLFLPFVALRSLAHQAVSTQSLLPDLREIYTAGEQLVADEVIRLFFKQLSGCFLENQYGPSESHVVTAHRLDGDPDNWPTTPPIGRAIANIRIHILDDNLKPCPQGGTGEICISGDCLAKGYVGKPALTRERFKELPAKTGEEGCTRIYRTGDLGRVLPDETIEFLGRRDNQVKIRGYRIEPGEIEAALGNHKSVKQAVVVDCEDHPGERSLVAFILGNEAANEHPEILIEHLGQTLPEYMIPSRFVYLDDLPLTPSGKVDRKALRELGLPEISSPVSEGFDSGQEFEEKILSLWRTILRNPRIGYESRFIDSGGHSLTAMRLVANLRDSHRVSVSVSDLLSNPTVKEFIQVAYKTSPLSSRLTIPRADRSKPLVLSSIQENIFLDAIKTTSLPTYNEPWMVHISEQLDVDILEEAYRNLIARHEILRTAYQVDQGSLYQTVHENPEVSLPLRDLSEFPKPEAEKKVALEAKADARQPMDLSSGQVIRCILYKISNHDYRLLVTVHHIVSDVATVVDVLIPDLVYLYRSLCRGNPPALPVGGLQYADFAAWERSLQKSATLKPSIDYWKKKLADLPLFELPGNHPRPAKITRQGFKYIKRLNQGQANRLEAFAKAKQETVFTVGLAAFKALLAYYTGKTDVVIGSISAGRDHPQTETMAGCFLNYLVLRTQLDGDPEFDDLLNRVKQTSLEAMQHQAVSYNQLIQILKPVRDPAYTPFYQIMFFMETATRSERDGWLIDQMEIDVGVSKIDLTVGLDIQDEELIIFAEHNRDLYDPEFIDELLDQFGAVLETVSAGRNFRLSSIAIEVEKQTARPLYLPALPPEKSVPADCNETCHPVPDHLRLHDFLSRHACENPNATAIEFGDISLTYGELDAWSNGCAQRIREAGVSRNEIVAIIMRRSEKLPVALFGILKAGAAYLPIDPDFPAERIHYILEDSGACMVILDPDVKPNSTLEVPQLHINTVEPTERFNPRVAVNAGATAYAIYTSGSTGKPKGALISHKSIVNRLLWMADHYEFSEKDCQLLKTPLTFDVSVHELFLWSLVGARLAISAPGNERDPMALIHDISRHQVSRIHFVPSMLSAFLTHLSATNCIGQLTTLMDVFCSGEALPGPLVNAFFELVGKPNGTGLHNLYGPTEAAIDVTFYDCSHYPGNGTVPIGKPVWNTQLHILDSNLMPVPMGEPGDLYIGGVQVGKGYLNQPELTAKKFIPDPFSKSRDARLYQTGDIARRLPDGNLEFLGRSDFQIKIRGIRIDPSEIEDVLLEHTPATSAVVVATEISEGCKRLVAYADCPGELEISRVSVRDVLNKHLPPHLVPAEIILLESMPLTASGKIDRKALPEPSLLQTATQELFRPETETQEILTRAWKTVLQLESLSREPDFFELGGDSILAIKLVSTVRIAGFFLSLGDVFEHSGLREMAEVLRPVEEEEAPTQEGLGSSPVNPIQRWFLNLDLPHPNHWNQSNLIEFKIPIETEILEKALASVFANHAGFHTRFQKIDGGWIQRKLNKFEPPEFKVVEAGHSEYQTGTDLVEQMCVEAQSSHDLASGKLCSTVYFRPKDGSSGKLFISVHHLVMDQVSWHIFLEDLDQAYQQLSQAEEVRLPAEMTSPFAWVEALRAYAQQPEFSTKAAYWKKDSLFSDPVLNPDLEETAENTEESTKTVEVQLDKQTTKRLLTEAHSAYNTEINDLLLTALATSLKKGSSREFITIFLEGHGREPVDTRIDLGRTTGWFTTLFPVCLRADFLDVVSAIKGVKEQLRKVPCKGIGYGLESCFEPAGQNSTFFPEVIFNYLGRIDGGFQSFKVIDRARPVPDSEKHPRNRRICNLEIVCWVEDDRFRSTWYYSQHLHQTGTIEHLARNFIDSLKSVTGHCVTCETGGYTPSDFKSADLTQDQLDDLLSEFSELN